MCLFIYRECSLFSKYIFTQSYISFLTIRFILALDRRQTGADMRDTVSLAQEYKDSTGGVVVGVDLSGDFRVSIIFAQVYIYTTEHN